jgi:hypothetical protein
MDFGKVLGRAWEITWRWKFLWVLGFLASLGEYRNASQSSYTIDWGEFERYGWRVDSWRLDPFAEEFFAAISAAILGLICVLFIIAIALWVISVISRGGLIGAVQQIEEEGSTSFRRAWAVGVKKFWTLFGLGVLTLLPTIILVIIGVIGFGLGIAAGVGLLDVSEAAGITTIVISSLTCVCVLICGMIILVIVLEQIRIYGERAAILEDLGWIDAFVRGWQVLKENLGATIILWLIFFAIGIVIFAISFVILIAVSAPFLGLIFIDEPGLWWFGPICFGGLLGIIIFALVRSVVTVFTSATWTLAYREFISSADELEAV